MPPSLRYQPTHLFNDGGMVVYQSLFERFSLEGGEAGVEGSQFPQGHNLVAHGGAGVLAGLRVAVDIVLALPSLMERNLQCT